MTKKEIETYLLLHEQKIETFVKSRSQNWLIAAGVAFVLFIVLVVVIFRKQKPTNEAYKIEMQKLDEKLMRSEGKIENLEEVIKHQDSVILHMDEAYKRNRPIETRIIHSYERIPFDINSLNREELRKSVTNY